jgi:hypothetical protein
LKLDDEDPSSKREIRTAIRKTKEGKEKQKENELNKAKNKAILKASLAKKDEDEGSGWESVEEDAPAIQLTELLDNMKIDGASSDEESKEES